MQKKKRKKVHRFECSMFYVHCTFWCFFVVNVNVFGYNSKENANFSISKTKLIAIFFEKYNSYNFRYTNTHYTGRIIQLHSILTKNGYNITYIGKEIGIYDKHKMNSPVSCLCTYGHRVCIG